MTKPKRTLLAMLACILGRLRSRNFALLVFTLLLLPLFFLTRGYTGVPRAYAATSDNLNFQARLETSAGAIAADGYYNLQFKLYDAASGGTLLWTETYYDSNGVTAGNDNRVRVANGYVTVNLGSQTAFPGTMPWDQQLYLTMNVGGTTQTATPTWDGEMNPRLKLTAVPYAFNAKTASEIVKSSGSNLATLSIAAPTSGNQTFVIQDQGAAGTYNLVTDGNATSLLGSYFIQNQFAVAQTGNISIKSAGAGNVTVALQAVGSQTADLLQFRDSSTATISGFNAAGELYYANSGYTATISTSTLTADRRFILPDSALATNVSPGTICVFNGASSNCPAATGSAFYIQNQTASAQDADYWIDGTARADTSVLTPLLDTATAVALNIGTTNATQINLNKNVSIAANQNITFAAGTGNFDQSASSGTFSTGTGAVNLNGDTTVASGKNLTVTSGTTSLTGTTNINTTGSATTTIGNASATNNITGTNTVLGATSINTTGTAGTTIGSATGGAVSITANAASSFTTNTGALTLTSAAAATWGTNAGLLTLQGAGGTTVTSSAGASSSDVTITTGNASAGASGNIAIDTGTATTTAGTVSIGTTNASAVTIGRVATTTTIQGNTAVTLSATTGTTMVCRNGSGILSSCDATFITPTATNFIQNQNGSDQAANFRINGTGQAATFAATTSVTTPLLDTATAVALNIATTNATSINLNQDTVLAAGQSITVTGGNTASRPASPTEGMLYYDTTTKQLLVYANGKWQADRTTATKIVGTSASGGTSSAVASQSFDGADYVNTSTTSAQTTINSAITALGSQGGTVYLMDGTYIIDGSITPTAKTTIIGSGPGTVIKLKNGINANFTAVTNSASEVTIANLTVDGNSANNTSGTQRGIAVSGGGSATVAGTTMTSITASSFRNEGIYITGGSSHKITNSQILANGTTGVYLGATYSVVSGNTIASNATSGVAIYSSNNTVSSNTLRANGVGVYVQGAGYNTITGNTISGSTGTTNGAGIDLWNGSTYNTITGNTIDSGAYNGISLRTSSNNNLVANNTISGNAEAGIFITLSSNNTIQSNRLHNNAGSGTSNSITLTWSSSNNVFTNNIITDTAGTGYAVSLDSSSGASTANVLSGNVFSGTGATTINDTAASTIYNGQSVAAGGLDIRFNQSASTSAFQIQSGTTNYLTADTSGNKIQIGSATTDATAVLFGLDSYNNGTDPTGYNGAMYYNTNTNKFRCYENGAWSNCTASAANVIQNQSTATQTSATFWIQNSGRSDTSFLAPSFDAATAVALNIGTTNASSITIGKSGIGTVLGSSTITLGTSGTATVVQGAAQATTNTDGNLMTIKGSAGNGSGNGGTLLLSGGDAGGTGKLGLVSLNPTYFNSASVQTYSSSGVNNLAAGLVDTYSTIPATASVTGVIMVIPDPAITTNVGRILYVAARSGSQDFTLRLNSTRTAIDINLKANSTATLIWNGTDWTAAGASSATDLQAAYNNTQTSAGGAEIILNPTGGAADGLTIRNNGTTPITGGIFEVQSSIGTNLLSVNSRGTELASNGGAETAGASSTTFPASTWSASGGTVARTTTSGQYSTGQAGVSVTAGNNQGVVNTLTGNPVLGTTYTVSFTAKPVGSTMPYKVQYSPTGGTNLVDCTTYPQDIGQTLPADQWSKVTCTIPTAVGVSVTNPQIIITKTNAGTLTFYVDNLSVIRNDSTTQPSNVQVGGGITGGQVTLFTLDRASAPPVPNGDATYYGSMYYDTTTGRIQCYEADGWGACGSAPDNIVVLTPEYSNAVLNGTGVGTLTADFCANKTGTLVVGTLCASGVARNFYRWTSPQSTNQTYSVYVSYKLPSTFKQFYDNNTIKLTGYRDSTNASMDLSVFRSTGTDIIECGSKTAILSTTSTWQTTTHSGNEQTDTTNCGFQAGEYVIFKIDVTAKSNANVYVENLEFRYTNT